jgi:hypothetical protein
VVLVPCLAVYSSHGTKVGVSSELRKLFGGYFFFAVPLQRQNNKKS